MSGIRDHDAVNAVRDLHGPVTAPAVGRVPYRQVCEAGCFGEWPCPTMRILQEAPRDSVVPDDGEVPA